jgi:hypothetical protein
VSEDNNGFRVVTIRQETSGFEDAGIIEKKYILLGSNTNPLMIDAELPLFRFQYNQDLIVLDFNDKNMKYAQRWAQKNMEVVARKN